MFFIEKIIIYTKFYKMGVIEIEDMEFYAYHGCYKAEREVGNYFKVYTRIEANCAQAAKSDLIADALNYQTAYEIIKEQMMIPSSLLEHVAGRILDVLFQEFSESIHKVDIKISKLAPPMGGKIGAVSVTLSRSKNM